jgi:hypothetical protein
LLGNLPVHLTSHWLPVSISARSLASLLAACSALVLLSGCGGSATPASDAASQPARCGQPNRCGEHARVDALADTDVRPNAFPTHTQKAKLRRVPATHRPATHRPATHKPTHAPAVPPGGPTAKCNDGTLSYSQHHQGTCSPWRGCLVQVGHLRLAVTAPSPHKS